MQSKDRSISWINTQKTICMIIIYLYHTEGRFGLNNEFVHALFFPFYVNSFFFISGYLLFKKNTRDDLKDLDSISWFYKSGKQMILNIFFRIGDLLFV